MSDIENWRMKVRLWLQTMAADYGSEARRGLSQDEDVALGRRYLSARYAAGFGGINWPAAFGGQGLTPLHKLVFEQEEMAIGTSAVYFSVSLGMAVPILMNFCHDTAWVKDRVVAALTGKEIWCQLFSEPAGGSDLAGLRTKVEPEGNGWKLNGQKLWTSYAQYADYGILVARNDPTVPKHKGLTYFWIDMHAPGVTVRPIKLGDGHSPVNEIFFDDVRLTDSQRMSPVGGGFSVAMATLMIERYVASDSGGFGPPVSLFVDLARHSMINGRPAIEDGRIRSVIARTYAMRAGLDAILQRAMLMMENGMEPGPEGSLNKLLAFRNRQRLSELAIDLMGPSGHHWDQYGLIKDNWIASWLEAPVGRIAGGTDEILLNTIAEKILGLPQDHRPDKGVPFNQIPS